MSTEVWEEQGLPGGWRAGKQGSPGCLYTLPTAPALAREETSAARPDHSSTGTRSWEGGAGEGAWNPTPVPLSVSLGTIRCI